MKRIVADAAAIADWFTHPTSALRTEYEAGGLMLVEPRHAPADLVGELAARTGADGTILAHIGIEVDRLAFDLHDPATSGIAEWVARGLDPRRAAYAALAEAHDLPLLTDDDDLRRAAGPRARGTAEA